MRLNFAIQFSFNQKTVDDVIQLLVESSNRNYVVLVVFTLENLFKTLNLFKFHNLSFNFYDFFFFSVPKTNTQSPRMPTNLREQRKRHCVNEPLPN